MASWSESELERSITLPALSSGTATSAYSRPPCLTRARTVRTPSAASSAVESFSMSTPVPAAESPRASNVRLPGSPPTEKITTREFETKSDVLTKSAILRLAWATGGRVADRERLGVALHLVELRLHEPALERRDDDDVRGEEGAADDPEQRQRQLDADAAGDAHPSRKR